MVNELDEALSEIENRIVSRKFPVDLQRSFGLLNDLRLNSRESLPGNDYCLTICHQAMDAKCYLMSTSHWTVIEHYSLCLQWLVASIQRPKVGMPFPYPRKFLVGMLHENINKPPFDWHRSRRPAASGSLKEFENYRRTTCHCLLDSFFLFNEFSRIHSTQLTIIRAGKRPPPLYAPRCRRTDRS